MKERDWHDDQRKIECIAKELREALILAQKGCSPLASDEDALRGYAAAEDALQPYIARVYVAYGVYLESYEDTLAQYGVRRYGDGSQTQTLVGRAADLDAIEADWELEEVTV